MSPENSTGQWTFPVGPLKRKAKTTKPIATQIWQSLFLLLAFSSLWAIGSLSYYRLKSCSNVISFISSCVVDASARLICPTTPVACPSFLPRCIPIPGWRGGEVALQGRCLDEYYSGAGEIKYWLDWARFIPWEQGSWLFFWFITWMAISAFIFLLEFCRVPFRKLAYIFSGALVVLVTVIVGYSCIPVSDIPMGFGTCSFWGTKGSKGGFLAVLPWLTFVLWFIPRTKKEMYFLPRKKIGDRIYYATLGFPIATLVALLASW